VFNLDEAEKIIRKAVAILAKPEKVDADYVVKVGVASVVIAVAGIAEDKLFFSGLGSEELFAGYERHEKAGDVNEECWRGLRAMWRRDLIRDSAVAEALDIELRTPFLDKGLIVSAMAVPGNRKINDKDKKIILREIAEELGLEEYAWRKKQGAQYGSRFDRAIAKLAKKKGFEKKGDYLRGLLNEI
ncbi:MAG: asparagine synthase C-terminal domain-containing protein, partial [Candidatus Nanoarchaeia archaeon]